MEVHHHSHTSRKKWTHYFWEFLMLFLAVFCGFLAENQREHFVEHQREKQYMRSMLDDLKSDTGMFVYNIRSRQDRLMMIDSLVALLRRPDMGRRPDLAYYYARSISPPTNIFSQDGTIQQLKSSGNLRLIRDREIANAIVSYDQQIRNVFFEMGDEVQIRAEYRQIAAKVFDACVFFDMQQADTIAVPENVHSLFNKDPSLLNQMIGSIQYLKRVHLSQLIRSRQLKQKAEQLIDRIKANYKM